MEIQLFDEVADAVRALVPPGLGLAGQRARRYGIKVWFGGSGPPREHYEAQVIGAAHVEEAAVLAIEVGFHAEHPNALENDATLAQLLSHEERWRPVIGDEAVAGPFLGRADSWRRVSETWPDPDLGQPGLGFDVAARLVDYISALEPLRRRR